MRNAWIGPVLEYVAQLGDSGLGPNALDAPCLLVGAVNTARAGMAHLRAQETGK